MQNVFCMSFINYTFLSGFVLLHLTLYLQLCIQEQESFFVSVCNECYQPLFSREMQQYITNLDALFRFGIATFGTQNYH